MLDALPDRSNQVLDEIGFRTPVRGCRRAWRIWWPSNAPNDMFPRRFQDALRHVGLKGKRVGRQGPDLAGGTVAVLRFDSNRGEFARRSRTKRDGYRRGTLLWTMRRRQAIRLWIATALQGFLRCRLRRRAEVPPFPSRCAVDNGGTVGGAARARLSGRRHGPVAEGGHQENAEQVAGEEQGVEPGEPGHVGVRGDDRHQPQDALRAQAGGEQRADGEDESPDVPVRLGVPLLMPSDGNGRVHQRLQHGPTRVQEVAPAQEADGGDQNGSRIEHGHVQWGRAENHRLCWTQSSAANDEKRDADRDQHVPDGVRPGEPAEHTRRRVRRHPLHAVADRPQHQDEVGQQEEFAHGRQDGQNGERDDGRVERQVHSADRGANRTYHDGEAEQNVHGPAGVNLRDVVPGPDDEHNGNAGGRQGPSVGSGTAGRGAASRIGLLLLLFHVRDQGEIGQVGAGARDRHVTARRRRRRGNRRAAGRGPVLLNGVERDAGRATTGDGLGWRHARHLVDAVRPNGRDRRCGVHQGHRLGVAGPRRDLHADVAARVRGRPEIGRENDGRSLSDVAGTVRVGQAIQGPGLGHEVARGDRRDRLTRWHPGDLRRGDQIDDGVVEWGGRE